MPSVPPVTSAVPEAVLPWWLSPEAVPPCVSPELGTGAVVSALSSCVLRQRVRAERGGREVWANAGLYTVLFTVDKSPPDA